MKWTPEETEFLACNATKMSHKKIAEKLNKTEKAVRNKCWRLGLVNRENYWNEEEVAILRDMYSDPQKAVLLKNFSEKTGRDKANIVRKAKELGLKTNPKRPKAEFKKERNKYPNEEERRLGISESMKKWHQENEHPRGMKGKHHSTEYCQEISKRVSESWRDMTPEKLEARRMKSRETKIANGTLNSSINRENPYSRTKGGRREDLGNIYFRSSWEANMARYFNFVGIEWQFEPKCFIFHNVKRGSVSYTPDFYLPKDDMWIEVKGWMDPKSQTKLKRFAKYYPEEYAKLEIIDPAKYKEFAKWKRLIPGWEE